MAAVGTGEEAKEKLEREKESGRGWSTKNAGTQRGNHKNRRGASSLSLRNFSNESNCFLKRVSAFLGPISKRKTGCPEISWSGLAGEQAPVLERALVAID